ncbi:4-hydroxythreonine-4-phosphate dehydrogenase PdxA [Clostridium saccharobutylicum]|uniref:Putative D-threonate 4-phosphate dehydrogenase n=1 Tax=Clostridium saccharobutylicum TaxID=169679 RepID=A0A1S8MNW3_CLOSA|nr:4-hydroxythreonine-4-phosphate dehydrogenase PdxA [Clostridium saccharobutylicum]OOM05870.1 4-hydroxythreonine-4-phosphate dehydrogenase 2 [Clostridium saccharobutylicum]
MIKRPVIGITMGDAAGIGPEIIVKALEHKSIYGICRPVVIGDTKLLERAASITKSKVIFNNIEKVSEGKFNIGTIDCINMDLLPSDLPFGELSPLAGDAAFKFIKKAVELAKSGEIQVICTAPLNKAALHLGGHMYPGHTEILAHLTETEDYSMMLTTPKLKVIHLTTHKGLIDAINSINPERTYKVINLANETLKSAGYENPRIAVAGINPHCGENGMFGYGEEEEKLIPAIEKATSEGVNVSGPYPADTVFFRAIRGEFDIVIACYHDQGHVAVKVSGFDDGVNITVGLKGGLIRTSVDHGTAFDIAGKNIADEKSMIAALEAAAELAPKEE